MTLQVAYGGGINQYLQNNNGFRRSITSSNFFEPGFNLLFPLEFQVSATIDTHYILLRKRSDASGNFFENISPSDYSVTVVDDTTNQPLTASISTNTIYSNWNENFNIDPLVVTINGVDDTEGDASCRIRAIRVYIKNNDTDEFIIFRILTLDDSQSFSYMIFDNQRNAGRPRSSQIGTRAILDVASTGSYMLLTPAVNFSETTSSLADFSYPEQSIYYSLDKTYNNEKYIWSISNVSDAAINDVAVISPVPNYPAVGVLRVDAFVSKAIDMLSGQSYLDITALNYTSNAEDIFRVYLKTIKAINIIDI